MKLDYSNPNNQPPTVSVKTAIDRAEQVFIAHGKVPPYRVHKNLATGRLKITLAADGEDGMQALNWQIR